MLDIITHESHSYAIYFLNKWYITTCIKTMQEPSVEDPIMYEYIYYITESWQLTTTVIYDSLMVDEQKIMVYHMKKEPG